MTPKRFRKTGHKKLPCFGKPEPGEISIRGDQRQYRIRKAEDIEIKKAQREEDRRQYRGGKAEAIEIKRAQREEDRRQYRRWGEQMRRRRVRRRRVQQRSEEEKGLTDKILEP